MKLSYRGQSYTAHTTPIKTELKTVVGTYRGAQANYQHQEKAVMHRNHLTYRGVDYAG
jgi:hypothetical protein